MLHRGDAYVVGKVRFPDGTEKPKYAIVLRAQEVPGTNGGGQVSVVVTNSDRRKLPKRPLREHEVDFGPRHGFDHDTLLDCRWVMLLPWDDLTGANYLLTLDAAEMQRVDAAIVKGLQLST